MIPPPISDVPQDKVGEVVQDFLDLDGVIKLKVDQEPSGNFTVTPLR